MITNKVKKIAKEAVLRSGKMLLKEFECFDRNTVKLKSHHEILTACDLKSEKIIISAIKKNFSDHQILSEEAGEYKTESDYLWIIDPIDGTTNFSMHNPLFSISLGLAYKGKIIFGIIYAPYMNEMFIAEKGKGAKLNNKKMKVSNIKSGKVLNAFCHGTSKKDIKQALEYFKKQKLEGFDCRQMGSAAIELAYVACGRIESIAIPGAHSWDVAAGILLVREAGGKVTDFIGEKWTLKNKDMLATNGKVHEKIIDVFKRI
ncbi:inositol monophosphatase [Candidatus Parcubacteria bacterium]|nr:inositol monophosphatase [Candidatus Parcubacteria bacterium]